MSQFQKIEQFYLKTSTLDRLFLAFSCLTLGFTIIDPVFYNLSTHANPDIKEFSRQISHLGRGGVVLIPAGLLFIMAFCFARNVTTFRLRAAYLHMKNFAAFIFVAVASAGLIALFFKNLLGRARPKFYENFGTFSFDPLVFDPAHASFPSGHATTSFAFAIAISLIFPKLRFTLISIAFWIALSRYLIGAHYMTDIVIGAILGSCVAIYVKRHFVIKGILFRGQQKVTAGYKNGIASRIQGRYLMPWYFRQYLLPLISRFFRSALKRIYLLPDISPVKNLSRNFRL